jgi:hypothetical protein
VKNPQWNVLFRETAMSSFCLRHYQIFQVNFDVSEHEVVGLGVAVSEGDQVLVAAVDEDLKPSSKLGRE